MKKLIFSILLSVLGLSVNSQARLALMTNLGYAISNYFIIFANKLSITYKALFYGNPQRYINTHHCLYYIWRGTHWCYFNVYRSHSFYDWAISWREI